MAELLACPFCRELFHEKDLATCPVCGVKLTQMHKLPPSYEEREEEALRLREIPPEYRSLAWTYLGRGKGMMLVLCALGLGCFFAPWVHMLQPTDEVLTGYGMAKTRAAWLWGGAVAWFICIPLVVSRRSVLDLRGIRVICTTFAAMTLGETVLLLSLAPAQPGGATSVYQFGWGLYASFAVSLLGVLAGIRLGGPIDDLRDISLKLESGETSEGHPVH